MMKIDNDAQQMIGCGFIILCILLGMGGCSLLVDIGEKYEAETHVIKAAK